MTKTGTLEQWQELGALSKEVYRELVELCVKADQIMPRKDWSEANKAEKAMSLFRSHAEDVMFRTLGEYRGASIHIFYGKTAEHYTTEQH